MYMIWAITLSIAVRVSQFLMFGDNNRQQSQMQPNLIAEASKKLGKK